MLHLFGVAAGGSGIAARLAGRHGAAAAALGRVERGGAVLRLGHGHPRVLGGILVEHYVLLLLEDQRALRAEHHLAVAAEAVAVDRRVGDDDLLVLVFLVARSGILVHAVDVVVDLAVGREDAAVAHGCDRQRLHLLAGAVHRRHEDAGGVELVAAELGHQASARAVPEPPADQLLQRRANGTVADRLFRVAILRGIDGLVEDLRLELGDLLLECVDVGRLGGLEILLPAGELLGERCVARHRRLPRVFAREVAAVPLGADRVDVSDQFRGADRVDGVVVEDAVVPLVAGGQDLARLAGHAAHLLALVDAVPHQLLGEHVLAGPHRLDGGRGVEVEGKGDHHRLDVGVGEHVFVGAVDLHLRAGRVFGGPLVLRHQPRAGLVGAGAGDVAVKGSEDVVGANVGDRDDVEILGIVRAEEHAPLVARTEEAHAERVTHALAVAEVDRAEACPGGDAGGHRAREEVAAGDRHRLVEVFLADLLLLFSQVHRRHLGSQFKIYGSAAAGVRTAAAALREPPLEKEVEPAPAADWQGGYGEQGGEFHPLVVCGLGAGHPERLRGDHARQEECPAHRVELREESDHEAGPDRDERPAHEPVGPPEL